MYSHTERLACHIPTHRYHGRMEGSRIRTDLARRLETAGNESLLDELFGTTDTGAIASELLRLLDGFGDPLGICLLRMSSGLVLGVDVASDLGRVVLKVHRAHVTPRLPGVLRAQRILSAAGVPVATPLIDVPLPAGFGAALVEMWRADGATVDVRSPAARRALARCCFAIIEVLDAEQFPEFVPTWTGLYPPPHSPRFDFEGTRHGAEWIDELARRATQYRSALEAEGVGARVVGHTDIRPENVLVNSTGSEPEVSTVYDLDSLAVDAEPWLVGGVARAFSTNWSLSDPMLPTIAEINRFVGEYEDVRGMPFSRDEALLAQAGTLYALAYSARCEHALFRDGAPAPWGSGWRELLNNFANELPEGNCFA